MNFVFNSFNVAAAREIIYEHLWSLDGDYEVNITLENLHSEKEFGHVKFIHNFTKLVHVQYPVLNFKDDEVVLDWFVSDEVDFLLTLDVGTTPPTNPYYNCTWGDSNDDYNVEFNEAINRDGDMAVGFNYHLKHVYTTAGVYDVTCTLFNMVSSQTSSKIVSFVTSKD